MEILIHRKWLKPTYTISKVYVDGKDYGCNCLEDTDRGLHEGMSEADIAKIKVKGATAIPTGKYLVLYTYSPRFGRNLPLLSGVRGFSGIRIHAGNTAGDTEGCLLFGKNTVVGRITDSRTWTNKITTLIKTTLDKGEKVYVKITNKQAEL